MQIAGKPDVYGNFQHVSGTSGEQWRGSAGLMQPTSEFLQELSETLCVLALSIRLQTTIHGVATRSL